MNTYNDVSLDNLSRECGTDPLNVLLDKSLEEKKIEIEQSIYIFFIMDNTNGNTVNFFSKLGF